MWMKKMVSEGTKGVLGNLQDGIDENHLGKQRQDAAGPTGKQ
jgi:hypothetical protein